MKKDIDRSTLLSASKDQVSADLSSDSVKSIVILNLKDGVYYELKDVAARVWNLIQQPCSLNIIVDTIVGEYEVDAEQCESDLIALFEDLSKRELIKI